MTTIIQRHGKRSVAMLLLLVTLISMFSGTAFAAQEDNYHDPADKWLSAIGRTNELDVNAVVTHETFYCAQCRQSTSFTIWRTPEYTRDGITAMSRNVKFSDGTCIDGESTGVILDGTPGKDAYYTGYHWTKACCEVCGTMNSNGGVTAYDFGKNVYWLFDCAAEFMEDLDETVSYEYADSTYHTKTTKGGEYCCFCYGTHKTESSVLERHQIKKTVIPQISNGRFAIVEKCENCSYEKLFYVAAKSVISDYYGVVDGQPHTLTVSDLSESGVSTQIRYGNSAETCTMTSAPNYTEEGQYTVYYAITYTYGGESMTENGVAYVWLYDENACGCGCGNPDCDCQDKNCNGDCCDNSCAEKHNFILIEKINPTCKALGYSRYACVDCGKTEKRDYVNALDHAFRSVVIREATCEVEGKVLNVCIHCGEFGVSTTEKGEHQYASYDVEATCTNPGYTVKACEVCGDRHITDITNAKAHDYNPIVTSATCENGGFTVHLCDGCGSSFVTDYTDPLGHSFDEGKKVTNPTCDGEGVMEHRCVRCGYHKLEAISAEGHTPDGKATCGSPLLCADCGAILENALGHDYKATVTKPTCTEMGYTTFICSRCEDSYKGEYTEATGHKAGEWIVDKAPTENSEGSRHKECVNCKKVLETEALPKIYMSATTDTHGEAVVGSYLVIVTDTDTKHPVANASVTLNKDDSISVRLPNRRVIDYADQTTVTVLLKEEKTPVQGMQISVTDKNDNYCEEKTDKNGQIIIPDGSGTTNEDGKGTVGYEDADGDRWTITVKVEDYETGRPIKDANVNIGKSGTITVTLPDGEDMDENNRITITVTDQNKKPLEDQSIIVKNDLGDTEKGKSDEDGKLTVPGVVREESHGAYIYGYPDGTFGAERSMTRSEAAAIFARLLAEKNGDVIREAGTFKTKFKDIPATAWYADSLKYLTGYGVIFGYEDKTFRPEDTISRAEFTAMAVRFFEAYGDGAAEIIEKYAEFTDISSGYWAAEYIYDAAIHGWIYGYGDGTFGAEDAITRAEVVTPVTSVDTASEALAVSIGEKARVDMEYMSQLSGKSEAEIYQELKGVIFLNPMYGYGNSTEAKYLMADEYLSGNVREKLAWAKRSAEFSPEDFTINVEALEKVQPKDLTASEIAVRLGATWVPTEIVEQFMFEFLATPRYAQWNIKVHFSKHTGEWNVEGKSSDRGNVKAYNTYGTSRINAYKIIEETLNLRDVRIFDYVEDAEGKKKAVLNAKETAIAQAKQEAIKQGFQDWIWSDPARREKLCKLYNEQFNSLRPREYDGSHITFNGMNPAIELKEHQKNAVAHILYGGNTLLAHAVGAGKTFEMVAAAMESKRLGLCSKSLFVVPNHITEQWAAEFLQLYPSANILVATKKDFETKNRKKFCGRIATGDYDAIIIGHSQFEKIPMSIERQRAILEREIEEITEGISELKRNRGDNFSVKQLERTKKSVKQKLEKLNDQSRKDDVVTFEELGVDRLFIDESHYYKNLFLFTKMRNVGGIAQTEAQKSSDLFMKCRYLDELTGGRGVVFATGTPISNSMVELYTIQRYLQYNTLEKNNLQHFDAWASTFGETITAVELTPEGTGYRAKTRFAKFYNLPELMAMFKEVADIKTADMLNLPTPKVNFHNIAVKPSPIQKEMVADLAKRAEKVRNGMVDSRVDNMLKITNDGRKLALDQRLMNPLLPDFEGSKLNACVEEMYKTWEKGRDKRLTQLFFCDLSTPKNDGSFSVYDDIRKKLIERGIPENEVRFIHEADTETKKAELFKKVRKGEVRILMGSTQKMGAGTNVQKKLAASTDFDCPWRPSDLEQRLGRSVRQGNENPEVDIYRFVTEETFDAYLYQLVEGKQKFASQIMTSKSPVRSCEDIDETALSYAEIKMLATGNPHIKEKMDLDIQVQKLRLLKSNFLSEKYALEDKIIKFYPQEIARQKSLLTGLKTDMATALQHPKPIDDTFVGMEVLGVFHSEKAAAGDALLAACQTMTSPEPIALGKYRGFNTELSFDTIAREYKVKLKGELSHTLSLGTDTFGNITRMDNALEGIGKRIEHTVQELENTEKQFETAKVDVQNPFSKEDELKQKTARLDELNILLNMDKRENEIVAEELGNSDEEPERKDKERER